MFYMKDRLGAWQVGDDPEKGRVQFRIFFPQGFDPEIQSIRVAGSFQNEISDSNNWDYQSGFSMEKTESNEGTLWTYTSEKELRSQFYQYKYLVTFSDSTSRIVSDPCTRYGGIPDFNDIQGKDIPNSGFVIGGSQPKDNRIEPLKQGRKPIRDLIIYEMNVDDFTRGFRRGRAPFAALIPGEITGEPGIAIPNLDYLAGLGINAILFMPWTGWSNRNFDWGYVPFQYFAVEYRYVNDASKEKELTKPQEKISWLKKLVSECHKRDIHVIMDGVFNHVSPDFPYKQFYRDSATCPYTGDFGEVFGGLQDLDFEQTCTQEFIRDVCLYWIETFKIDGIRFDNTKGYYRPIDNNAEPELKGIPILLENIQDYLDDKGEKNFSLTLEHMDRNAADLTNKYKATSYWDNAIHQLCFNYLVRGGIDSRLVNALNNDHYLQFQEKAATIYLSNHDHSFVTWMAGAKENIGSKKWFKTQPYAIALFCCPGVPMIQNGQEFGEEYWMIEYMDDTAGRRVIPRPLRWKLLKDDIGKSLYNLYKRLIEIRKNYPGLRDRPFYPQTWAEWQTRFDPEGFGIDTEKQVVIFRRWGNDETGSRQQFIIVLNFSDEKQYVTVHFPENGVWTDLLSGLNGSWSIDVKNGSFGFEVGSNWGHIFFKK